MRVQLDLLNDVRADVRVRAFGDCERSVRGAFHFVEGSELVNVLARLKTKVLEEFERRRLADD